jgi:NAD(P) transhydrogenase subunit alpha
MYVNVAVLKETQPHERRVALAPKVVPKLVKLGAKLHMQTGAGDAIKLADSAFKDVAFIADRKSWSPTPTLSSPSSPRRCR